jgi:uncharacterized repeat protein (TIGR03987 family)
MDGNLIIAIFAITLALIFYTIGVWAERRCITLKLWHVIAFWAGLLFDTIGTITMTVIANSIIDTVNSVVSSIHGISGGLAIMLMIIHALWASIVLYKNDQKRKQTFHRFSILVWSIWLIPYAAGMLMGMI